MSTRLRRPEFGQTPPNRQFDRSVRSKFLIVSHMADSEAQEQAGMLDDLVADWFSIKMSRKKMSYQSYRLSRQSKQAK